MTRRLAVVFGLFALLAFVELRFDSASAQTKPGAAASVPRAIRRDVPLTNAIRRAYDAGTRDMSGRPGPNYWQVQTDYAINARLDPATQTITGSETITLHHNGPQPMAEIYFRLDHNIFRGLVPRGGSVPAENTEGMIVTRLAVNSEAVDLAAPAATGRGAGVGRRLAITGLDQTLARLTLATAIAPKSIAKVEVEWRTKLPGGPNGRGHRMTQRFDDILFQPTQWFPRIAKYDDLRGWDTNVYLGPSEFYNNFGRFDVRIDVPAGWIVSGTGVLQNPDQVLTPTARERLTHVLESDAVITIVGPDEVGPGKSTAAGDRLVWRFLAEQVNDFAWATAKNFVWRATRATIPGKGPVPIHMVHLPERANLFANAGPITRHALEFYSKLWAPYPFPQLTLQDGPSTGMEYPMVINSNQGAADHEAGHQWWPMMVGNNETWYGWMDEGFNQYMNILSEADARKSPARSQRARPGLRRHQRQRRRAADDVEREQRRQHVQLPDLRQDAAHALDARRHRRRRGRAAGDEHVRKGVGVQAPVALGLRVPDEPGAQAGPELVLVLLALDHRIRGRIDCLGDDVGHEDDRHGAPGWPDAVTGGAESAVRSDRSRGQADGQHEDGQ